MIKYLSIASFIVGVVPFDDKKNPLLPVFTKFSPRDFKVQHPKTIIAFREFDPDIPEEKEIQILPVRLFEKNLCTTVTVQFTQLQQASLRQFSQCPRRPVEKTHLTYTLSARSSLWSLHLHFTVVLVQQTYHQDVSILNSVKNNKRRNQPSLSGKKKILPFLTLRALVRLPLVVFWQKESAVL